MEIKKDVLVYFAGKTIPAVVNLAIIILAVRILGKEEYGKYALVFYGVMLISTLTSGWIQQSILRFLSAHAEDEATAVSRFYFLTLASILAAVLISVPLCLLYFRLGGIETAVVSAYLAAYNNFLFHLTLNQARRKTLNYVAYEGLYSVAFLGIFLLLALAEGQRIFTTLFWAMLAGLLVTEFLRTTIIPGGKAGIERAQIGPNREFASNAFRFGFPITIWLFLSMLLNISDRFFIKEFAGYGDTGTYSAIKDLIIKLSTFTTIPVILAFHPAIVQRWNQGAKPEAMHLIRKGLTYCLLIGLAVIGIFLPIRTLLYSRVLHLELPDSLWVSTSLLISAFLWQAALLVHKPLELLLRPGLMLMAIVASLAVNTAGNLLLIPRFGFQSAAFVSMLSVLTYIIIVAVVLFRFKKQGRFSGSA